MSDRFYLTTAIAYANNRPGLHTLYEVVGRRRHRALAPDDRRRHALPDRHRRVLGQHRDDGRRARARRRRRSSTRWSGCFRDAEDALWISPDRFIRTTDPDHCAAVHEMIRRAHANGDIYLGTYEGWYCPNEGFRNTSDLVEDALAASTAPNHPDVAAAVAHRAQLVLPPVGLPGAPRARTTPSIPSGSSPSTAATRCSASSARASRTSRSAARAPTLGHPVPAPARRLLGAAAGRHRGTRRPARSTSGTTRSSTTSRAPASRTTRRRSSTGGRPTSRSSARTSTASTRSTGRRCS